MARCRDCNAKVRRNAEYCPQCGVRHPAKQLDLTLGQERSRFRISTPLGIVVLVIITIGYAASHSGSNGASGQAAICKSDWTRCTDNADLVNNYLEDHSAQNDCKQEAVKLAKYGDPKFPWLYYFDTFHKGDQYPKTGVAVLIEKDAQYQNGFGAMVHSEVTCTYDLRAMRVLNIDIEPE